MKYLVCLLLVVLASAELNTRGSASHLYRHMRALEPVPAEPQEEIKDLGDFLNSPEWKELVKLLAKLESLGNQELGSDEREDIDMNEWRQLLADMDSPQFRAKWGLKDVDDLGEVAEDDNDMYMTPEWKEFMMATATKENLQDPEFLAKWQTKRSVLV